MSWLITGDKHGDFGELLDSSIKTEDIIIILGDAGLNYYLNKRDNKLKKQLNEVGCQWYMVRGNHESRPQYIPDMIRVYDLNVDGWVWYQPDFPNIHYFEDFGIYTIDGLKTAVIGGAYSVDKHYRLERGWQWFADEELSDEEIEVCERMMTGQNFDLVLTHTCPLSYEPYDLFLSFIDQSTVSKRMEKFLDRLKNKMGWGLWLFGHFHADRIEAPHVEQFYHDIEKLTTIIDRWREYDKTGKLDWWIQTSPNF